MGYRVFTTALTLLPTFGSVAAGDAVCATAAADAGLPGGYIAWLSSPDAGPLTRFPPGLEGQWVTDAGIAFRNFAQLRTVPSIPLDRDERGRPVSGSAWTGTLNGGASSGATCTGWSSMPTPNATGTYGQVINTAGWTNANAPSLCASPRHLYCFQVQ